MTRGIHSGAPGSSRGVGHAAGTQCLQEKCFRWISRARASVWTKRAKASREVKASVIDGELGALKRRAACTRVGPAASPEGIRTVSCSGALTFYGRVPRHCAMQAHVCPSVCPLLSTSQPDPLLGARTCRRLRSVVSPEQRQDGQAQGRKLETNRLGWEPGASRFRPGLGRLRGGGGFCPGFWRHEHVGLGRTVA